MFIKGYILQICMPLSPLIKVAFKRMLFLVSPLLKFLDVTLETFLNAVSESTFWLLSNLRLFQFIQFCVETAAC
jgi:hypothetical protein